VTGDWNRLALRAKYSAVPTLRSFGALRAPQDDRSLGVVPTESKALAGG
jgi:hypothetical protein